MPKYFVFNSGVNPAVEFKPGIGEFTILPNEEVEIISPNLELASHKQLAESIVHDSQGKLQLRVK